MGEIDITANHPRLFCTGIAIVAIAFSLPLTAILAVLFEISPVLFGAVIMLSFGAMWFLWLEPFGRSITRDVVSHMHELDE